jgi:hypothetical protein
VHGKWPSACLVQYLLALTRYLYLYELEFYSSPWSASTASESEDARDDSGGKDSGSGGAAFHFDLDEFVRIESTVHPGAVYYGQILKKRVQREEGVQMGEFTRQYYVHYNGWSSR